MMDLTFGNPLAVWALLGIPVVLLIHFFQRERRQVSASTLFLLDPLRQESQSGIRFENLRNSLVLWLQILTVVLIAWILAEPRRPVAESFQRVVVVMDSSASMAPFEEEARRVLGRRLARLSRLAAHHEWIAVESDARLGTLYSGGDAGELERALGEWRPRSGTHDPEPALRRALASVRGEGVVLFVTSRPREALPAGVHLLSVGEPIDNCGFTGLVMEERDGRLVWRALVKNFSDSVQQREWRAEFDGLASEPREIELEPNQTVTLSGVFPEERERGALYLSGDSFPLDDWLPLARPEPKELVFQVEEHPMLNDFAAAFLPSVSYWQIHDGSPHGADIRIATRTAEQEAPRRPGVYFLLHEDGDRTISREPAIPENHPLVQDLNWHGLLVQGEPPLPELTESDEVLLWHGERPLLVLRVRGDERWLFCNFDLRRSNAARLPAFVVLLHRFVELVREEKHGFERMNLQTGQRFVSGVNPYGPPVGIRTWSRDGTEVSEEREAHRAVRLTAPLEPGYLEVWQGGLRLIEAAVYFAEAREADFRTAAREESGGEIEAVLRERQTRQAFLSSVWLLLLGVILVATWRILAGERSRFEAKFSRNSN